MGEEPKKYTLADLITVGREFAFAREEGSLAAARIIDAVPEIIALQEDRQALLVMLQKMHHEVQVHGCPICKPTNKWGHVRNCPVSKLLAKERP